MDKTDVSLIMLLSANSRLPYSELAKKLNLSVNAVHKRIQLLVESGVICKFTAKIGMLGAPCMVVFVYGTSQLSSFHELREKLKHQDRIYWSAEGGGKFLYMGAYLHGINELPDLINYVKKEAGIPEPTVGIMAVAGTTTLPSSQLMPEVKPADLALCELDLKIIRSLKDDSRKAVSDVASELGVSRRL